MQAHDLALLRDAAADAGKIAKRHFLDGFDVWDKGGGQGPVTEADLEIDRMLHARLCAARPDYGWLSEETEDDPARLNSATVFIVDPIDGTRAFVEGKHSFSTALAIASGGIVTAAVVHLPMKDLTYHATLGGGAFCNDTPLSVSPRAEVTDAAILAGWFNMEPGHWHNGMPPAFSRHFRPSLAYRMALVADGQFDGMLTLRDTWEWDVAAGTLLVTEAGGAVSTRAGDAPKFNNPRPALPGLLAGGNAVHAGLRAHLA